MLGSLGDEQEKGKTRLKREVTKEGGLQERAAPAVGVGVGGLVEARENLSAEGSSSPGSLAGVVGGKGSGLKMEKRSGVREASRGKCFWLKTSA